MVNSHIAELSCEKCNYGEDRIVDGPMDKKFTFIWKCPKCKTEQIMTVDPILHKIRGGIIMQENSEKEIEKLWEAFRRKTERESIIKKTRYVGRNIRLDLEILRQRQKD